MKKIITVATVLMLTACAQPNQNRYNWQDVGQASVVEFGTVIAKRHVDITGQNTGAGALAGGLGGGIAGASIGHGNGSLAGMVAGALIAGVAGNMAEQAISDHTGIEYTITLKKGVTVTLVQNESTDDAPIHIGERVMIQDNGLYRRVLPASDMPTAIKRPKDIQVVD